MGVDDDLRHLNAAVHPFLMWHLFSRLFAIESGERNMDCAGKSCDVCWMRERRLWGSGGSNQSQAAFIVSEKSLFMHGGSLTMRPEFLHHSLESVLELLE